MTIQHHDFGLICGHIAKSLSLGLRNDVAVQLAVTEFNRLEPSEVADVAQGAIEHWQRLQAIESSVGLILIKAKASIAMRRYQNEPRYHHVVNILADELSNQHFSADDLREIVELAIRKESERLRMLEGP